MLLTRFGKDGQQELVVPREYVGHVAGPNAGPDAPGPVSVPEPGSFLLLASGLSTLGGLLAGKWYVTRKQAKRPERPEPSGPATC